MTNGIPPSLSLAVDNTAAEAAAEAPVAGVPADASPDVKKIMDELPGMVGGIDHALIDMLGKPAPFVLVIFAEGGAMHATNFDPKLAAAAVKELAASWDTTDGGEGNGTGAAPTP